MTGSDAGKPFVRLARILFAVVVVAGSAAVGYWSSLIWPLTTFSGSKSHTAQVATSHRGAAAAVPSTAATTAEVASGAKVRTFDPVVTLPSLASEARNLPDPAVLLKARAADHAKDAAPADSTGTDSAKVERHAEENPPSAEARTRDTEQADTAPARASRANRRTVRFERRVRPTSGTPKMAQSAAPVSGNYERVPILKQFMTSTNRY